MPFLITLESQKHIFLLLFYKIMVKHLPVMVRFMVDEIALAQVFLGVLWFSPFNHYFTIAPYSSNSTPKGA
jgi:hypothetical protein